MDGSTSLAQVPGIAAVAGSGEESLYSLAMPLTSFLKDLYVRRLLAFTLLIPLAFAASAGAQDNYEIQVYGADTVAPRTTMVELHSNFTVDGSKAFPGSTYAPDGTYPTTHVQHETVEITQGLTKWSELGFYIFTSIGPGPQGWQWVGDHIRPRVRAPDSWHWPVGVSISNEIGYQRARFSPDTWTWEIRPIVDKQVGRLYLSFNPTFDRSFHGPSVHEGFTFSPNVKAGYDITKKVNAGIEYYGDYGDVRNVAAPRDQQQQFFVATDLNVSPQWEFNFGIGVGTTASTDHLIVKAIVGRRFSWPSRVGRESNTLKGDVREKDKPKK